VQYNVQNVLPNRNCFTQDKTQLDFLSQDCTGSAIHSTKSFRVDLKIRIRQAYATKGNREVLVDVRLIYDKYIAAVQYSLFRHFAAII
jgi:hypothetical protein